MAENSKIGWTDHTHNFWWGCNKVSKECRNCYIGPIMRRGGREPFHGPIRTRDWSKPARWNRQAQADGRRLRVFTCSMSDFFHPGADAWRSAAWDTIRSCDWIDWLVLTKRPELIRDRLPSDWGSGFSNVWLGVTCGHSSSFDRLKHLRRIPARIRFVSAEPLLERLDFRPYLGWINWVITGCEQAARGQRQIMEIDWVRDIDRQCKEAGVAHFFKQAYVDEQGKPNESPLLDGVVVQDLPETAS